MLGYSVLKALPRYLNAAGVLSLVLVESQGKASLQSSLKLPGAMITRKVLVVSHEKIAARLTKL